MSILGFTAKTTTNELLMLVQGAVIAIGEKQSGQKPKLLDIAFGDYKAIKADLESQGYNVEVKFG